MVSVTGEFAGISFFTLTNIDAWSLKPLADLPSHDEQIQTTDSKSLCPWIPFLPVLTKTIS